MSRYYNNKRIRLLPRNINLAGVFETGVYEAIAPVGGPEEGHNYLIEIFELPTSTVQVPRIMMKADDLDDVSLSYRCTREGNAWGEWIPFGVSDGEDNGGGNNGGNEGGEGGYWSRSP